MVPNLNGFREVGVCAEIRCENAFEHPQHVEVCVWIRPQPRKLVVVNEEMHALMLRVLAAFRVVKADKAISIAHFRNKARRVKFTRTAINHFIQIFIVASLPVDHSAAPLSTKLKPVTPKRHRLVMDLWAQRQGRRQSQKPPRSCPQIYAIMILQAVSNVKDIRDKLIRPSYFRHAGSGSTAFSRCLPSFSCRLFLTPAPTSGR